MEATTARAFLTMADTMVENGYRLGPKIGEGTYAKVRICERDSDGTILAAKIVNLRKASPEYLTKFIPRELSIIQKMDHKNIIKTHEIIQNEDVLFMILDYAEKGDLLCFIREHGPIPDREAREYFSQIVSAVQYLHEKNIAHRDLKCENILIMRDNSVVLSDFGFARFLDAEDSNTDKLFSKTFCGSPSYASPEVLCGIPYDPMMSDVWSLGVLLYIMVSGTMPYDDSNVKKMVNKQLEDKLKFPSKVADKINSDCKILIRQILEPVLDKRLTVEEILQSDWLTKNQET